MSPGQHRSDDDTRKIVRGGSRAQVAAVDPAALDHTVASQSQDQSTAAKSNQPSASANGTDQPEDDDDDGDTGIVVETLQSTLKLLSASSPSSLFTAHELIAAGYHVFILMPIALGFAVLSHLVLSRSNWIRGGGPRRISFPVRRTRNWTFRETAAVAVVNQLLPSFIRLSRTRWCPSAERLIPLLSDQLFGIKHAGWAVSAMTITLKPLPQNVAIQLSSETQANKTATKTPSRTAAGAVMLWKSHASNVSQHEVKATKPAVPYGGIGGGKARENERVILLLSGSSYADRDPLAGLMACNLVNQTGLRLLCVNWRKPAPLSGGTEGRFPAGLNDALEAYVHLVETLRFKPENVYLAGESSGAAVAMGVMIWLSALSQAGIGQYGRPGKVILWNPWCDLKMQSPTWRSNASFDIVNVQDARKARDAYVASISPSLTTGDRQAQQDLAAALSAKPEAVLDLLTSSISRLGLDHPFLSPGLPLNDQNRPFNTAILKLLSTSHTLPKDTQYLIFCGRESVFAGESASLASSLLQISSSKAQDSVTYIESVDTPTCFNLLPSSSFLPLAHAKGDQIIMEFLVGDVL